MTKRGFKLIGYLEFFRKDLKEIGAPKSTWIMRHNLWLKYFEEYDILSLKIMKISPNRYRIFYLLFNSITPEQFEELHIVENEIYFMGRIIYTNLYIEGYSSTVIELLEKIREWNIFKSTRYHNKNYYEIISKIMMR